MFIYIVYFRRESQRPKRVIINSSATACFERVF